MSESQSRYSIVERLTKRKLDIMSAKSELGEELYIKERKIETLEKDLENWERDIKEDIIRDQRQKETQLEAVALDLKNLESRLEEKRKVYDAKLKTLDDALKSIEHISETTPTVNK